MQLINKKSKIIRQHKKFARFSPFVRFTRKYIHFPLSTVELANLMLGKYLHLVDAGKETMFLVNDDPAGYILISNSARDAAVRTCAVAAIDWFCTKHKIKLQDSVSFYVIETNSEFQGQKLFQILTDTPRPENKKKIKK